MENTNYSRLLKIKQLADRGVDGEQSNARLKLELLLQKHGVNESDLKETPKVIRRVRSYPDFLLLLKEVQAETDVLLNLVRVQTDGILSVQSDIEKMWIKLMPGRFF